MRLMRFNQVAEYAPGKTLVVADALSRSPQRETEHSGDSHTDVECYVAAVVSSVPASPQKMDSIRAETAADEQLQEVIRSPHSSTGVSPAELLMGRQIRITLPTLAKNLQPKWPGRQRVQARDTIEKEKQTYYDNKRHGVRQLTPLQHGDHVLTELYNQKTWTTPAVVTSESTTQRSYIIETEKGALLRRNRRHLQVVPVSGSPEQENAKPHNDPPDIQVSPKHSSHSPRVDTDGLFHTRSGQLVKPVQRLEF
ncbi:hypothetical protein SKAU_G00137650 [Synaphobranchus kaupii]|uniref:Uncharacterized protein n=1 Tax=Synaphobranchus kaupii TaxID=118154 RepID=A0A9Q1FS19_SYNKA|nr:hypothetical protein SKAU_G00137650 [Synaphobranchus kaupii]